MQYLSEILILTLLHSLWQSALVYLCFISFQPALKNFTPLVRRNFLLLLTILQLFLSLITALQLSGWNTGGYLVLFKPNLNNGILQIVIEILMYAYLMIAGTKLGIMTYRLYKLPSTMSAGYAKAPVDLRIFTNLRASDWGIKRKVEVFISTQISSPLTYGFLKPVILLPACMATGLNANQLESILIHELSHIRNMDYLSNLFLLITESVYFFNPFIRRITAQTRLEQEKECDRMVLNFKYDPASYAETLLQIASMASKRVIPVPAFSGSECQLMKRVRFIASPEIVRLSGKRFILPLLFIPVMALLIGSSLFSVPEKAETGKFIETKNTAALSLAGVKKEETSKNVNLVPQRSPINRKSRPVTFKYPKPVELAEVSQNDGGNKGGDVNLSPADPVLFSTHVSAQEQRETKQLTLKEELSGGRSITYGYTLTRVADKWEYQLDWIKLEDPQKQDSLLNDSLKNAQ